MPNVPQKQIRHEALKYLEARSGLFGTRDGILADARSYDANITRRDIGLALQRLGAGSSPT